MKHQYLFCFAIFFIASLFSLQAQKKDSVQQSANLEEVVVTAPRMQLRNIIPPQKLSGKELRSLSSFSVADAMRYFAGVQVKDYGGVGGIKTINIRSMGTHHVGIFYDGIELGNAQNGQVDLGQYSLDNMEAIQIYNGQKGSYLQPAKDFGSSGSVYMQTRRPLFSDGKVTNVRATLRTGSFALLNPSLLVEHRLSQNISGSFNAEWVNSDGRYKFRYLRVKPVTHELAYDTTAIRENGDINATRMEASLFGSLPGGRWTLKGYNYNSERGIPGAIVNNVWRRGERLWDTNSFLQGGIQKEFSEQYQLNFVSKYAHYRTHYVNNDDKQIHIDNLYKQKELYLSLSQAIQLASGWHASLAYDYQWNRLDGDLKGFLWPIRHTHLVAGSTTYTNEWLNAQVSLLGTFVNDFVRSLQTSPSHKKLTPAVLLSIKPFGKIDLHVNAFFKDSFRMPTFNDLYYADIGNSKLNPEWTRQYNLGLEFRYTPKNSRLKKIEFKTDGYYNHIKDKIVAYPKGQQFRWTILNLGQVDIRGIDALISLVWEPIEDLLFTTRLQYTYQKAIDITSPNDSYYCHQIPYIPWHSGSAIAMFNYKGWQLNYNFMYVGERYNQQENILYNYTQPWYTNDLSIAKDFVLKGIEMRAQMECNNLLNQDYDVIINYPMPMRNYRFTLTLNL